MAGSVGLESRGSWDAEVEFVAVMVWSAVTVARALALIVNWLGDTDARLTAFHAIRAFAFRRAAERTSLLWDHCTVGNAEAELIALVASGAFASLASFAGLVRLRLKAPSDAETDVVAVIVWWANVATATSAESDWLRLKASSNAEAKLIAVIAWRASATLPTFAGAVGYWLVDVLSRLRL